VRITGRGVYWEPYCERRKEFDEPKNKKKARNDFFFLFIKTSTGLGKMLRLVSWQCGHRSYGKRSDRSHFPALRGRKVRMTEKKNLQEKETHEAKELRSAALEFIRMLKQDGKQRTSEEQNKIDEKKKKKKVTLVKANKKKSQSAHPLSVRLSKTEWNFEKIKVQTFSFFS
jgi:hypothetical protein